MQLLRDDVKWKEEETFDSCTTGKRATWLRGMSDCTMQRREYMMAEYVTAGGALVLPYVSGPVPSKSNVADLSFRSIVT